MKKAGLSLVLGATFLLAACGNLENSGGKVTTQKTGTENVVATGKVTDDSYQALMVDGQYKTSVARTMAANRMNSQYNLNNYDRGLIELSKESFATKDYYIQEGQYLDTDSLKKWLARQTESNALGLNPKSEEKPLILQQVIEKNFINISSKKLGGLSIGLALNSVDYSTDTPVEISDEELSEAGKKMAAIILPRLREIEGIGKDVPIQIALFKQASRTSVEGGHYFATAISKKGDKLSDWAEVDENYITLPVKEGTANEATEDGLSVKYSDFKNNIQGFFPNLSGFSGKAHYRDGKLQKLAIEIDANYYSVSELESFTQFIGNSVTSIFKIEGEVTVQVNQLGNTKATVVKPSGQTSVIAQVFQ